MAYDSGASVPEAFPMLDADAREQLQSGLHGDCWAAVMDPIDAELTGEESK